MIIRKSKPQDVARIMEVWESSVRATHDFLSPADFEYFKQMIPSTYLGQLEVYVLEHEEEIKAYFAHSEDQVEMFFVHADFRGLGIGKFMMNYILEHLQLRKLDVNAQNQQAVGFYLRMGFQCDARSERDSLGKPYPILHLSIDPHGK